MAWNLSYWGESRAVSTGTGHSTLQNGFTITEMHGPTGGHLNWWQYTASAEGNHWEDVTWKVIFSTIENGTKPGYLLWLKDKKQGANGPLFQWPDRGGEKCVKQGRLGNVVLRMQQEQGRHEARESAVWMNLGDAWPHASQVQDIVWGDKTKSYVSSQWVKCRCRVPGLWLKNGCYSAPAKLTEGDS